METNRRKDGRETWNRLLNWDKGQTPSERLAGLILASQEYKNVDPSHPLGGKDGGKDVLVSKDELNLVAGVYFPRGQKSFKEIKEKFLEDLEGVAKNETDGIVFLTNQEIRLSERTELVNLGKGKTVEIYHLERISLILNSPENYGTRLEFLDIAMTKEEIIALYEQRDKAHLEQLSKLNASLQDASNQIIGLTSGGNSVPLVFFNSDKVNKAIDVRVRVEGEFPIYDVSLSLHYMDNPFQFYVDGKVDKEMLEKHRAHQNKNTKYFELGTLSSAYVTSVGKIKFPESTPMMVMVEIYSRNKVYTQIVTIGRNKKDRIGTMKSTTTCKGKNINKWVSTTIDEYST